MAAPAGLQAIVDAFARKPGRSAFVAIRTADWSWSGGMHADAPRPAASLLKVAIGMAVEPHLEDLAPARVADLVRSSDVSVLHALAPDRELSPHEIHSLMLSASDAPSARWAASHVGLDAIRAAALQAGCDRTEIVLDDEFGVLGTTTARNAVDLILAATEGMRFPASARALRRSIVNARIPLGATAADIRIAHKSGTLNGVANDVAHLDCSRGEAWIAFLSEAQHDTLVTGYEMGVCTRELLESAGMQAVRSRSFASPLSWDSALTCSE